LAVIGAGAIGRMHAERARLHPQAEVVAIADPSPAAREFARQEGLRWFADYTPMLDEVRPEGAIVATPNATHVDVGLACIARGILALIEKPVADDVEAAQQLSRAASDANVPLLVGHHRRHNPILRRAKEIVVSGRLGTPVTARARDVLQARRLFRRRMAAARGRRACADQSDPRHRHHAISAW
jgi:predicted dehydrogenase